MYKATGMDIRTETSNGRELGILSLCDRYTVDGLKDPESEL